MTRLFFIVPLVALALTSCTEALPTEVSALSMSAAASIASPPGLVIDPTSCGGAANNYSYCSRIAGSSETIQIGANSCTVPTACLDLDIPRIGHDSCNGEVACGEVVGQSIGDNSCNGTHACDSPFQNRTLTATGQFVTGNNSCNGPAACSGASLDVGHDSCLGPGACLYAGVNAGVFFVEPFSCRGTRACAYVGTGAGGNLGEHSCNGEHACDQHIISGQGHYVGGYSCNGDNACELYDELCYSGDRDCNVEPSWGGTELMSNYWAQRYMADDPTLELWTVGHSCWNNRGSYLGAPVSVPECKPLITATATNADGSPYTAGTWTNQSVTVHFSCAEGPFRDGGGVTGNLRNRIAVNTVAGGTVTAETGTGSVTSTGFCTDVDSISAPPVTFELIKIDKTAPTLNPVVSPNPVYLNGLASVTAGASDALSGVASTTCGALNTASLGTKSVTCSATDNSGNSGSGTVSYNVLGGLTYNLSGFAQPVDMNGVVNIAKAGLTVPLKFRVLDSNGVPYAGLLLGDVKITTTQTAGGTASTDAIEVYSSASGLQYLGDGHYHFNWKTATSLVNTNQDLSLRLEKAGLTFNNTVTAKFAFRR